MNINGNNYAQFTGFILILVFFSTAIAYAISFILTKNNIVVPFYIEIPSITAIYAFFFTLFDKYFWKFPIFKKIGIIVADDLNGKWQGIIKSSHDNFLSDIKAELNINQTATNIKVHGIFDQSRSVSIHESFGKSEVDDRTALFYFYRNEPQYDATETMVIHEGSVKLIYNGKDELSGYYYSGRDRNHYGTISVKKVYS
jgi:hypothetical protein